MLTSINPASNEVIAEYHDHTDNELETILQEGHEAYRSWRTTALNNRSDLMQQAAQVLLQHRDEFALLIAREMGKPVKQGRGEIEKCALVCEYYAQNAAEFLTQQNINSDAAHSFVSYQPQGTVLAVMPWNFPFWQVFRFAAPALMAGNVGVLKHASNVTGCALAIEQVFHEAGFDERLFRTLKISSKRVASVIEHPVVQAVTLTGSGPAGRAVAAKAGEMLKKSVLELGGSDPYIILADADLEQAAEACVTSRLINSGQSCIAAKRFIVIDTVKNEFEHHFVEKMQAYKMGDPLDEKNDLGPQARTDLRDELHQQVQASLALGAVNLLGNSLPEMDGAYYPASVLSGVKPGMPAYDEELFGPVAAIITAADEDDAVRIANDSDFGLGAAVFSRDLEKAEHIAAYQLEAGCCFINDFVKSDPRLPFGGIKQSGYGRELSWFGIQEFVNIKTVYRK